MDPQIIVALMSAGGGGALLLAFINGIFKWLSGASSRERQRNTDLISQRRNAIEERDKANEERDIADDNRRMWADYAARLRRRLYELGEIPEPLPDEKKLNKNQEQSK